MLYVITTPDLLAVVASDVAGIGSSLRAANAAAAAPTTAVAAAAADEVSAAIASLFAAYGRQYQALNAQAAAFHTQFVESLTGAGIAYAASEAASVTPLQLGEAVVLYVINFPTNVVLGRPLIGAGRNGAPRTGQAGGGGGLLWGNGGTGGSGAPGQPGSADGKRKRDRLGGRPRR
jgi:hypothetical protein